MPQPKVPTPVIIDTDPGVDDVIAILLAIASPELEIIAYVASYGNTDRAACHLNILKVYNAIKCHIERFPADKDRFPNFNPAKPAIDGLGDITDRHQELTPEDFGDTQSAIQLWPENESAVDVALAVLETHPPRSVTYIALGPLTNLALMMRKDSQLVCDRIGRIICMGGALDVPGNTSPVAEFNFFADPYAVKELLISTPFHGGLPKDRFILLPLDITTPHELPFPVYKDVVDPSFDSAKAPSVASEKAPLTHFTSSFLERTREIMLQFGKDAMELHDIVAVWCAIEHPPLPENEPISFAQGWLAHARVFDVERTGELTRGMLVVDRREDESAYPLGANRSEAQREPHEGHDGEANVLSKAKEVDISDGSAHAFPGVACITRTPGADHLLRLLLKRVWGCTMP